MPEELRQAGFVALWHPGLIAVTALLGGGYLLAIGRWRDRFAGSGPVSGRQICAFLCGLFTFYLAVGSPLDFLSDNLLASAHMAEHMLLTFVMAPLLLLGTPGWLIRPVVIEIPAVRAVVTRLTRPLTAMVLFNLTFSVIHVPLIYDLTLRNDGLHFLEHALLVVTALLMWWPVLSPLPELPRLPDMVLLGYLFVNEIFQTIAFGLITFANHPLYAAYAGAPQIWGITRMEDQQASGLLMKLGAMASIVPAMWDAFFRWARREGAHRTDFLDLESGGTSTLRLGGDVVAATQGAEAGTALRLTPAVAGTADPVAP